MDPDWNWSISAIIAEVRFRCSDPVVSRVRCIENLSPILMHTNVGKVILLTAVVTYLSERRTLVRLLECMPSASTSETSPVLLLPFLLLTLLLMLLRPTASGLLVEIVDRSGSRIHQDAFILCSLVGPHDGGDTLQGEVHVGQKLDTFDAPQPPCRPRAIPTSKDQGPLLGAKWR